MNMNYNVGENSSPGFGKVLGLLRVLRARASRSREIVKTTSLWDNLAVLSYIAYENECVDDLDVDVGT